MTIYNQSDLQSLKILETRAIALTTIPQSIGNLQSLKVLDLDENNINHLPESILNLKSLEVMKMAPLKPFPHVKPLIDGNYGGFMYFDWRNSRDLCLEANYDPIISSALTFAYTQNLIFK